jgi:hypothetical protein
MYKFTTDWFQFQKPIIQQYFPPTDKKISILEIGAFEKRSTTFYIDNYLSHRDSHIDVIDPFNCNDKTTPVTENTLETFIYNISNSKYPNKISFYKDFSSSVLPTLNKTYDYITIDASHLSHDVLTDTVLSYRLLVEGGTMFFDDYGSYGVRKAVDSFMDCFSEKMEKIYSGYHYIAKKK